MVKSLEGKVVAILGASSGIGQGIARAVAREGVRGIVLAARRVEELNKLSEEISQLYKINPLVVETDATNKESLANFVNQTIKKYSQIDIVVNSAGVIQEAKKIENVPDNEVKRILETNLIQVYNLAAILAPIFEHQGNGIYSIISSQAGLDSGAFSGEDMYCMTKASVNHLARTLDKRFEEQRKRGKPIYALALCPGFIDTLEARRQFPDISEETWRKAPKPEKFGEMIIPYIASPEKYRKEGPVIKIETLRVD